MNNVCLIGRLTSKPELKYTSNNLATTRFTIAVNRTFTNQNGEKETDYINVIVWRKQAENVCQYLDKGSLVSIDGRIQTGSYNDKDGKKVYTTDVIADNVQFLESKKGAEKSNSEIIADVMQDRDPFEDYQTQVELDNDFLD